MRVIGKQGGRKLVIPMVCMIIGALALSGVWPFSGFFSKEAVLGPWRPGQARSGCMPVCSVRF